MIKEGVLISGRYQIMGRVGTGGMADVYKAMDTKLNRYVAVKVLKQEFREDELFVQKFRTEAQSAAGLTHANIVNVYDVGEDRGLYYIVMELVEGITLKEYIKKKGHLTPKEVISIAVQVCSGIQAAHANNIIHRDIKPQNIIISKEGKVKVTDFGIAKATSSNTISTNAMGSVHYTSPEQARGGFSDAKSDIYSLGITMYEMITGELPFDGESTVSIALKHLQEDITEPSEINPDIPYSLEQIILKCTQKSPDRRYATVNQLERDLRRSLSDPDGDFVVIAPLRSVADTVVITQDELNKIQKNARPASRYEDDYEDDFDDDYDEEDDTYDDYEEESKKKYVAASKGKKEIDPKMTKIMRILTIVVAVIFAFILLFAIGKASGIIKMGSGSLVNEEDMKVPNLLGKTVEEAEKECGDYYTIKVVSKEESEEYPEGYIIRQKTGEGVEAPEGTIIQVVVSSGLKGKEIEMPDVMDKEKSEAISMLVDAGFKKSNITVETKSNDEIQAGNVCATYPEVGSVWAEDGNIILYISEGTEKVIVPTLVGKTASEAKAALERAGLKGNPTEVYSSTEEGKVIKQEVNSGTQVDKGTTINYTVSKGEEPVETVTIPTGLEGKSYSSVYAQLKNLGLQVDPQYEESSSVAKDYVIYVEGAGYEANKGDTVIVVVSAGSTNSSADGTESGTENGTEGNSTDTPLQ